jgi:hypothetical protein
MIFFKLFDVGRNINLNAVAETLPASPDIRIVNSKDSPESLSVPVPLRMILDNYYFPPMDQLESLKLEAKCYDEGVITMIARLMIRDIEVNQLHTIRQRKILINSTESTIGQIIQKYFERIHEQIKPYITNGLYVFDELPKENYLAFCFFEPGIEPNNFLNQYREYFAALISDENPTLELHESRIEDTLAHPFSYFKNDMTILETDRCIIIDPNKDYEDVLLIIELANFQLLELRVLDKILDRFLDVTEDEIGSKVYQKKKRIKNLSKTLSNIQSIRIDAMFILENLENVSKIIGDFFLGQIYQHLLKLFNTPQWSQSIRIHLELLEDLYNNMNSNKNEHTLLGIEWVVAVFFLIEIIFSLIDFFEVKK